jgi:hypothetical protein
VVAYVVGYVEVKKRRAGVSLRLDVGLAYHPAPLLGFVGEKFSEVASRAGTRATGLMEVPARRSHQLIRLHAGCDGT